MNDWILLGSNSGSSTTSVNVAWDANYLELKFVATYEISATGDIYVSPYSSSGSGLAMVVGSRIAANNSGGLTSASATWSNNVIVLTGPETNSRGTIEGTGTRSSSAQWRTWNVWGSRNYSNSGQILWQGSQANGTETRELRLQCNGRFLNARLAVWGRDPY